MIELAGTRYAVGKTPANTMVMVAAVAFAIHGMFLAGMLARLIVWRPLGWTSLVAEIGGVLVEIYVLAGACICAALFMADKQSVDPTPHKSRFRSAWHSEPVVLLRSRPPVLTALVAGCWAAGAHWVVPTHSRILYALYIVFVTGLMAWHGRVLYQLARRMRREATTLVCGKLDKRRDWDWSRYPSSDADSFKARFGSWKYPGDIRDPAEADDCARRARARRGALMMATAGAVAVLAAFVSQPLAAHLAAMAHRFSDLTQPLPPASGWEQLKVTGLLLVLFVPVLLQYRATEYPELAKLYDERAKELRAQKAQRRVIPARKRPNNDNRRVPMTAGARQRHAHMSGATRSALLRHSVQRYTDR